MLKDAQKFFITISIKYLFDAINLYLHNLSKLNAVKMIKLNFVSKPKTNVADSLLKLARCYVIGRFTQFALSDFKGLW